MFVNEQAFSRAFKSIDCNRRRPLELNQSPALHYSCRVIRYSQVYSTVTEKGLDMCFNAARQCVQLVAAFQA